MFRHHITPFKVWFFSTIFMGIHEAELRNKQNKETNKEEIKK